MGRIPLSVRVIVAFVLLMATVAIPNILPGSQAQGALRVSLNSLLNFIQPGLTDHDANFNKLPYLRVFDGRSVPAEQILREIDRMTRSAALEHQVDANLIRAVIFVESTFRPRVKSHAGAKGLMQITDVTARHLGVQDPFDPEDNIRGGAKYLRALLNQFKGDIRLALAAYNAGPTNVRRHRGIPPFKETRQYVERVLKAYERLQGS